MAKKIVWHGTFKNFEANAKGKVTLAFQEQVTISIGNG